MLVDGLAKAGWPVPSPDATMFCWAPVPEPFRALGLLGFAKLLLREAEVAVSPGIGFGEYGEGYVRLALVENRHRLRQAVRNIRAFLAARQRGAAAAIRAGGRVTAMQPPLRIGIAGLGTVGGGTLRLLRDNAELLAGRAAGRRVAAVSARGRRPRRRPRRRALARRPARWPRIPRSTWSAS